MLETVESSIQDELIQGYAEHWKEEIKINFL